jgi:hypothetical protein
MLTSTARCRSPPMSVNSNFAKTQPLMRALDINNIPFVFDMHRKNVGP